MFAFKTVQERSEIVFGVKTSQGQN